MRIGLDVMGGDHAPDAILQGAFDVLPELEADDALVLAGSADLIHDSMNKAGVNDDRIEVVPTTEVIGMSEAPVEAVRGKPDSSIAVLARLGSRRKARSWWGESSSPS